MVLVGVVHRLEGIALTVLPGNRAERRAAIVVDVLTCSPCSPSSLVAPLLALTIHGLIKHRAPGEGVGPSRMQVSGQRRCTTVKKVSRAGIDSSWSAAERLKISRPGKSERWSKNGRRSGWDRLPHHFSVRAFIRRLS